MQQGFLHSALAVGSGRVRRTETESEGFNALVPTSSCRRSEDGGGDRDRQEVDHSLRSSRGLAVLRVGGASGSGRGKWEWEWK